MPSALRPSAEPSHSTSSALGGTSSRLWLIPATVGLVVIVLLAIAAVMFLGGIGKHDIGGSYLLVASDPSQPGIETTDTGCQATGRMASSVLSVEDAAGTVLSSTGLGQGTPRANACEWRFTLAGVPEVSTYVFKLDGRPVGTVTAEQLQATNWATAFTEDVAPPPADLSS